MLLGGSARPFHKHEYVGSAPLGITKGNETATCSGDGSACEREAATDATLSASASAAWSRTATSASSCFTRTRSSASFVELRSFVISSWTLLHPRCFYSSGGSPPPISGELVLLGWGGEIFHYPGMREGVPHLFTLQGRNLFS